MNCFTKIGKWKISVYFFLLVTSSCLLSFSLLAQETTITGTVTGLNNAPLSGVNVTVKGTSKGVSTNTAGGFTISAGANSTLVVSYIGYASQEINVAGRTDINVALVASNTELEQVVVVGYGTQRKRDLTGSITSVKGDDIARQPNTNPISSLQGKVAGLTI